MDWWQKLLLAGVILYGAITVFALLVLGAVILVDRFLRRRAAKRKYEHLVRGVTNGFISINEARILAGLPRPDNNDDTIFQTVEEFTSELEQHRPDKSEVLVGQLIYTTDRDWRYRNFDDSRPGW